MNEKEMNTVETVNALSVEQKDVPAREESGAAPVDVLDLENAPVGDDGVAGSVGAAACDVAGEAGICGAPVESGAESGADADCVVSTQGACAVSCADAVPESLTYRLLNAFFALWDSFLDLLIALHILEETLPDRADAQGSGSSPIPTVPTAAPAETGAGVFSADLLPDAAHMPLSATA